ncbi:MAG: T9SS type A sorting domain-containing protein [Bacteroidota bacterium]
MANLYENNSMENRLGKYLLTPLQKGARTLTRKSSLIALAPLAASGLLSNSLQAQCGQGTAAFDPTGGFYGDGLLDVDGDGNPDFQFDIYSLTGGPALFITVVGTVGIGTLNTGGIAFSSGSFYTGSFGTVITTGYEGLFYLNGGTPFSFFIPIVDANGAGGFITINVDGAGGYTVNTSETGLATTNAPNNLITFGSCASLPVELVEFTVNAKDANLALHWQTASESNNDGFAIERSVDGQNWAKLGWVDGNGTTTATHSYEFLDDQVLANVDYYYRLKQIDYDGKFTYSDIVKAAIEDGNQFGASDFYPNPVSGGTAVLSVQAAQDGQLLAEVYDATGRRVTTQQLDVANGLNTLELAVTDLANGQYFVKIQLGEGTIYKKLMIQR